MNNSRRMSGKVLQWNYDDILSASEQKCCFSLQKRDVALILAITEQMRWKTRYLSPLGAEIDQNLIDLWASGLERRLMDGCCPDGTLSRFTSAGIFQTSVDDGATWQDNTDDDPRNQGTTSPPLPGSGDGTRCAAADNVRDQYAAMRDQLISLLTAGTTIIAIVAGIAGFIGVVLGLSGAATGIGVLLIGMAAALLSLTPEAVAAAIDDTALHDFRCLVFCRMQPNGQLTYGDWQNLLSDIDSAFSGFALTFFKSITQSMGYIGISNAGTMGVSTASDCDDCDCPGPWCYTFDFTLTDGGWVSFAQCGDVTNWLTGVGWKGGCNSCAYFDTSIEITFTGTLTDISFNSYLDAGSIDPDTAIIRNGTSLLSEGGSVGVSTHHISGLWTGSNHLQLFANCQCSTFTEILSVTLKGTGVNPFGDDNCS